MHHLARGFAFRCALALFWGLTVNPAEAQPAGGQVVAGTATISPGAGALTVTQTSARAIIHWQDFSLAAGGLARFIQPDATSATLNRVVSGLPSSLQGTLEANGRLYLINPNGILVGAQARIDTAGFLASTLDVVNHEFLAGGDLHFTGGSTAAIRNLGTINALGGDVFLIARAVENAGTVAADHGTAGLAAGAEVLLTTGGDERLFVLAASVPGAVVNSGTITAATAELKAAGGNAFALAINNAGTVRATGTALRNGQLWLVATGSGTVANSGTLDASGTTGGGRILVMGGLQDGGRVTVGGTLDASSTGGDGGFIETSAARVQVMDDTQVTTLAPAGRNGTWLIDPVDFTIAASGGDMTGAAVGTALAGGNFTIQSTTGATGTAGDVNVNDPVSWSANKLTLNAQNNINVNALLTGSGTASLALEYGQGAVAAGNTGTYLVKAAITLPSGNNFSTKLGSDGTVRNFTVITSLGAAGSTTATDLQGMAGNLAGLYALGADIDASPTSGWNAGAGFAPIGTTASRYTGTFDGLGHTVNGLTIARPAQNDVGLIGYLGVGGVLRNIKLAGGSVTGNTGTGALLGSNSGSVSYTSAATTVSGLKNVGGLIGASLGPVANVWASGNVSNVSGGTGFVGGLVGNSATGGSITNGWASGNVTATGPNAGGLVGFNSTSVISNTYATGTVSGTGFVGGLVGSVFGNINNSYATGAVTGSSSRVGGLTGHIYSGMTVSNSYATGSVAGTSLVGGFTGSSDGTVTNGYWDSTVTATGMGSGTGATGRTTTEMKALASFTGFDLSASGGSSATWRIYEGNTTPWLRVFLTPLTVTANNDTKTYNGTAYAGSNGVTYSIASPSPAPSGSLAFGGTAQAALNAGTYAITTSGLFSGQQGHDITHAAGTLTINPADLTLSGTRVYDRLTGFAGSNLTATGVNGESFAVGGAGDTSNLTTKNVQTNQLLASVVGLTLGTGNSGAALAANYNSLAVTGSSVSVTPRVVTIRNFASDNKVYNGTTTAVIANAGVVFGAIPGDTVTFSQSGATFDTKDVGTGKTVTLHGVTLTGSGDELNYSYTGTTTDTSDITAATLTYTATPANRTYGSSNPTLGGTIDDFVNSETQTTATTGTLSFTTTATVSSNVGTYAINGAGLTANNGNYLFTQAAGNATALTINPANLVLTGTRIYDASTIFAGVNLTATGVNGESFTVNGAGATGNLSTKNLQTDQLLASVTGLTTGTGNSGTALASNYNSLAVTGSTVSVTPKVLTIAGFASDNKVYSGTAAAVIASAGTLSGVVLGDTVGFSNTGATFDTKDVGTGKTVTLSGVTLTGSGDQINYSYTATTTDVSDITPGTLTYTATPVSRTYGSINPTLGGTIDDFVNSETQTTATTGTLSFTTTATVSSNVG
ncbi:MAG: YDG domain-containing protein, partial [Lacunisphaera sp.]|nr:YDG domain-containing protein [Lacunisphaera sp.]